MEPQPRLHYLNDIEVEKFQVTEVLRCLLHTILFHRALGAVKPEQVCSELFGIAYCKCNSSEADAAVEDAVRRFTAANHHQISPSAYRAELTVRFFEQKTKKFFGIVSSVDKRVWEEWHVPIVFDTTPRIAGNDNAAVLDRKRRQQALDLSLRSRIIDIAVAACDSPTHVPPIDFESIEPLIYHVEIAITGQAEGPNPLSGSRTRTRSRGWSFTGSGFSGLAWSSASSDKPSSPRTSGSTSGYGSGTSVQLRSRANTEIPRSSVGQDALRQKEQNIETKVSTSLPEEHSLEASGNLQAARRQAAENQDQSNSTKEKSDGYLKFRFWIGPPKIT